MTTASWLNKSEATQLLHNRYDQFIIDNDLEDQHPNFQSLLHENLRNPNSVYASSQGYPKGNIHKYGLIETIRFGKRPHFARSTLNEWFDSSYAVITLKSATKTH